MKKLSAIIIAMALVLGLSQCKKQETPTTSDTDDGKVYITVNVNDGAKHEIYPSTGAYVFTNGDILYVGNNGHFVGTLEYQSGAFSGSITSPSTSDYLHFYFTGGKTPAIAPTAGSTESFTVSIADQSSKLPVLSYGRSTQLYTDANATYSTTLRNKCGLVKFVPSLGTSKPITVSGMKTTATIDFATPGITPTDATGAVTLYSVSDSEKWAILLPQDEVTLDIANGYTLAENFTVPAIAANSYLNNGIALNLTPKGAINGKFTIDTDGKQVYFSQGNLQYQPSTNTWRFAEDQYDLIIAPENMTTSYYNSLGQLQYYADVTSQYTATYSGWIDLFGWGTSGWNNGNVYYQPYNTESLSGQNGSDFGFGYGPTDGTSYINNLTGAYVNADWGVYNAIANGGNTPNQWHTLTTFEWRHVFGSRVTPSGIRFAKGIVNDVNGVILLPDDWNATVYTLNDTNNERALFSTNEITLTDWETMEINGAVFLPETGYRGGKRVYKVGERGYYWSSTSDYGTSSAFNVYNTEDLLSTNYSSQRSYGHSVRLVRDVQ